MDVNMKDHNVDLYHKYVVGLSSLISGATMFFISYKHMTNIDHILYIKISLVSFLVVFISTALELFFAVIGNQFENQIYTKVAYVMAVFALLAFLFSTISLIILILNF